MNKAQICPVCNGSGDIAPCTTSTETTVIEQPKTCHGCDGKGWVEVGGIQFCPYPHPSPWPTQEPTCGGFIFHDNP